MNNICDTFLRIKKKIMCALGLHYRILPKVYDIEKKIKTSSKFKYPHFEMINWFAAINLYHEISQLNIEERRCPNSLLISLKSLLANLKQWNTEKDYNTAVREQIPYNVDSVKLLKDISKEIRHAERYINQLNPPKPERESKRKRKRPVNKDFDYCLSPKYEFIPPPPKPDYAKQSPMKILIGYNRAEKLKILSY